jgi:hypothetical protein
MHEADQRRKKNRVKGRSFQYKSILKSKTRSRNSIFFQTLNQNVGNMAWFRNIARDAWSESPPLSLFGKEK